MKCPTLEDLPTPPPDRHGFPWTEECKHLSNDEQRSFDWPRISIVTPSYNQGEFIEETIRSVLLQGYPDIEYIIIDGGSTDETVKIIKKYSAWLAYWVSEPDRGQSHAINKGLNRATGDVIAYINSDDMYLRNAFQKVARAFRSDPAAEWMVGACYLIHDRDHPQHCDIPRFTDDLEAWYGRRCGLPQTSTFLSKRLVTQNGLFEETLSYAFDQEYWIRLILSGNRPVLLRTALAAFRLHHAAKTSTGPTNFRDDLYRIEEMQEDRVPPGHREQLRRSRSIRRWETEVRDGLQLCAAGRWGEGSRLLVGRIFDRRLPAALILRPDIVARVLTASARRFPGYLREILRDGAGPKVRSRTLSPSEFKDPLGEYDLWRVPHTGLD